MTGFLFLEDNGHENFTSVLTRRFARQIMPQVPLTLITWPTGSGQPGALTEYERFVERFQTHEETTFGPPPDLLVVCVDAEGDGWSRVRDQIADCAEDTGWAQYTVAAVPDPCVEQWYLRDVQALRRIFHGARIDVAPAFDTCAQCKKALADIAAASGEPAPLGGIEHGEQLASEMDLDQAVLDDRAMQAFRNQLREALRARLP